MEKKEKMTVCSCLQKKPPPPYLNLTEFDRHIDNFWLMNCPLNYTVTQVDEAVKKMIGTLLKTQPIEKSNTQETKSNEITPRIEMAKLETESTRFLSKS